MKSISSFTLNTSAIAQDIRRCECILFGEEPEFAEKLNLPRTILEPRMWRPEFVGPCGLTQLNIADGFLGTIRRFKVKTSLSTPSVQFCISNVDSKEIRLVPCCKAVDTNAHPSMDNNSVETSGVDCLPIINEVISILTIRAIIVNTWKITREWNNIQLLGEITKSAFYSRIYPVEYEPLRPINNHKRYGIFIGNLKIYEVQMNNDSGKIVDIQRMVPNEIMGIANDEDNAIRLIEAYLHLTAKTINCLASTEKMEFIPCNAEQK